MVRWWLGS